MGEEKQNIGRYKNYLRKLENMKKAEHSEQSSMDCDSEGSGYDEDEIKAYEELFNKCKAKEDVQFYLEFKKIYRKDDGLDKQTKKNIIELVLEESGTLKAGDVFMEGTVPADCGSCGEGGFCYNNDNLQGLDEYRTEKRGTFFIFTFTVNRDGANRDCENYQEIARMLGFKKIIVNENQTERQITKILTDYGEKGHRGDDCVVCAIAAHGKEKDQIAVNGGILHLNDFVQYFGEDKCKGLRGKPKLIIVQACRGDKMEYANHDSQEIIDCTEELSSNYNDLLLASSCIPDTVSVRDTATGSFYIQCLRAEIESKSSRQHNDICEILTNVSCRLSKITFSVGNCRNVKQMSCFRSNLTKKLCFKEVNRIVHRPVAQQ